ncbi:hypothetical protein Mmah_0103 [Methanohalophilus mahii DSM 5219]|uniref:Uncharacterized protein n=1 Tax=Methanohalophilus mahii (strain ATCC 35705 / DSM 5219 / SLP) TaxID=547558 RepID=D5E8Y0_METMS|nr:hypothetical protein Mmah_0103 [Methanohalophilus mahii DSM 5219]
MPGGGTSGMLFFIGVRCDVSRAMGFVCPALLKNRSDQRQHLSNNPFSSAF